MPQRHHICVSTYFNKVRYTHQYLSTCTTNAKPGNLFKDMATWAASAFQDFLKAYQQPERRLGVRRARRVPGTVSGRTPKMGTMWMSSTLGGASGAVGEHVVVGITWHNNKPSPRDHHR